MTDSEKEYMDRIMEEGCDLVASSPWPEHFDKTMKLKLLENLLDHFKKREDIQRCIDLTLMINQL